jgi:hypothetical protein
MLKYIILIFNYLKFKIISHNINKILNDLICKYYLFFSLNILIKKVK